MISKAAELGGCEGIGDGSAEAGGVGRPRSRFLNVSELYAGGTYVRWVAVFSNASNIVPRWRLTIPTRSSSQP